ncbi:MAG TPA: hypothetical protein VH025_11215 [Solirubrobacteraceae bacterium]|jgi:hypothetical protein|nr:hypothetical protein [Solirubrobacteraceae bacterium]
MSYFDRVEQDLRTALQRGAHLPWHRRAGSVLGRTGRGAIRGRRPLAIVLLAAVSAGSALAATGVIPLGSPVKVGPVNARVAAGVPAQGGSRLLALRVPDPAGGLPWGVRVVHTTRGLICLQVARVQNGRLGELGIDGAFHDDGRFHPVPADALPTSGGGAFQGGFSVGRQGTICQLPGESFSGDRVGVDRSAGGGAATSRKPRAWLRDIYYGALGPLALSVRYRADGVGRIQKVAGDVGAYLIVLPTTAADHVGTAGAGISSSGSISPARPLTAIAYRANGGICENRVDRRSQHCPSPAALFTGRRIHPIAVRQQTPVARLEISHGVVRSASVSFVAPLAAEGAAEDYRLQVPTQRCGGAGLGFSDHTSERDIAAGERVTMRIFYPFDVCRHVKTISVFFDEIGEPPVHIGAVRVAMPPGTSAGPDHSVRLPPGRPHHGR